MWSALRFPSVIIFVGLLLGACGRGSPTSEITPTQSAMPPTDSFAEESCIPSGDENSIQNALTGVGSKAVLCPNAEFELSKTVSYTYENQEIYTQGFPKDDSRALLKIVHKDVSTAVSADDLSGVKLRNVIIDGSRPELGVGPAPAPGVAAGALISWGGVATGQVVEWVRAYEPRGWSVLHVGEGHELSCTGAVVRNNEFGPGGRAEYGMSDGISLACRNSIVENNTIVDVTDGGIVIFQAPGSLVANNTIRSESRVMFYGISMIDTGPYDGDFTGTRVTGNVIDARGALMRHGIDMGAQVGCVPPEEPEQPDLVNRGATVTDNTLRGDYMGYGFVVSGVEDWTVTGNVDRSTHVEPESGLDCFEAIVDPPAGFQMNAALSSGTFQEEFEDAELGFGGAIWPLEAIVSIDCLKDLIGTKALEKIKAGRRGSLWPALEASKNGELIGRCMSIYEPPEIADTSADVMVGVFPCEPFCAVVELTNLSETETVDMQNATFILDSFPVQCVGLPASLQPGEVIRCTIEDFVTEGFQVVRWYGFPPGSGGWGFDYPFEDEG